MKYAIRVCISSSLGAMLFAQSPGPRVFDRSQARLISGAEARDSMRVEATLGAGARASAVGNAPSGLPKFSYSVTDPVNRRTYSGQIVGVSQGSGATIPVVLVPVVFRITQGSATYSFDPTQNDPACLGSNNAFNLMQNSPLFQNVAFEFNGNSKNTLTTQYADAFLRTEFANFASASGFGAPLGVMAGAPLVISVNAGIQGNTSAEIYSVGSQCGTSNNGPLNPPDYLAVVNINTVDALLQAYISANGLTAGQFPFFVTYNAVLSQGSARNLNNCCVLGYHNQLSNGQTYGIAEFEGRNQTVFSGISDVAAASHEINEWINDPSGANPTPSWGNIGQESGCQSNFEVGDPLSGSLLPPISLGGFSYHLQELAYFSWFYGLKPSTSADGFYSNGGTFRGYARPCPPGGTN